MDYIKIPINDLIEFADGKRNLDEYIEMANQKKYRVCSVCGKKIDAISRRQDIKYCGKCGGAREAFKNKINNNEYLKIYNKVYKRMYARCREGFSGKRKFKIWNNEAVILRDRVLNKTLEISVEEFEAQLNNIVMED